MKTVYAMKIHYTLKNGHGQVSIFCFSAKTFNSQLFKMELSTRIPFRGPNFKKSGKTLSGIGLD